MEMPKKLFNKNFFLLWQGQTVSNIGSQIFSIAVIFWIKHTTDSASLVGLILMTSSLPAVLMSTIGGAAADRFRRRNIIVICDLLNGIAVLMLSILFFVSPEANDLIITGLFVVSIYIAFVNSFFQPAITAAVPDLVPKEKISGANSLTQFSQQFSLFIGQGMGGVLFRVLGAPLLILLNGISYIFSSISELFIKIPQKLPEKVTGFNEHVSKFKEDIKEGFHYVMNNSGLKTLVLLSALLNFLAMPIIVLLPFYIEDFLKLNEDWYGFMLAAFGFGSVIGYLIAGTLKLNGKARGAAIIIMIILESVMHAALGLISTGSSALILALTAGTMSGFVSVSIITILQITTESQIRGRVFGFLTTLSGAMAPLGMGLGGILYDFTGRNITAIYIGSGILMTISALLVSLNINFRDYLTINILDQNIKEPEPVLKES